MPVLLKRTQNVIDCIIKGKMKLALETEYQA